MGFTSHRTQETGPRAEPVVNREAGDAGAPGDRAHAHAGATTVRYELTRSLEDGGPRPVYARLPFAQREHVAAFHSA